MSAPLKNHIQGIIDLGNFGINLLFRTDDGDDWDRRWFQSVVSTSPLVDTHPDRIMLGDQSYLIGNKATSVQCDRTGRTDSGKIDNALPLTLYALLEAVGIEKPLSADLVFTCPSVKAYGDDITTKLQGSHQVTLPADAAALIDERTQTIRIDSAIPQLEGYQAYRLVKDQCPNGAVLVDLGSRTILITVVDTQGRILNRYAEDDCGCSRIIERIYQSECLVGFPGLAARIPSVEQVTDYLLHTETKKALRKKQAEAIAPHVLACVQNAQEFVREYRDKPVYLLGGGALFPGITHIFSDKSQKAFAMDQPTWATLLGLATVANRLFSQN